MVTAFAQMGISKVRPFAVDGVSHWDVSLFVCL